MADIEVSIGECQCPGHYHNGTGDIAYLRPKPSVALGLAVEGDILLAAGSGAMLQRAWALSYIRHGVTGWNRVDEKGKDRPLDVQELLDDWEAGMAVAEKADELYGDRVVNPLVSRLFEPSGPGQTSNTEKGSTSPRRAKTRSPSGPSSPATTADTPPSTP